MKRRPKSPNAMPGREVRDSGFYYWIRISCLLLSNYELGSVGEAYQCAIHSTRGVVVLAQLGGGEEQNAADGDFEVFCERSPVCSCFRVGIGIIFFVGVSRFPFHFNV